MQPTSHFRSLSQLPLELQLSAGSALPTASGWQQAGARSRLEIGTGLLLGPLRFFACGSRSFGGDFIVLFQPLASVSPMAAAA